MNLAAKRFLLSFLRWRPPAGISASAKLAWGQKLCQHLAAVVLLVLLVSGLAWRAWPTLVDWHDHRRTQQLASDINTHPDQDIRELLHQLTELGRPGLRQLVALAASQRQVVASEARRLLEKQLDQWQIDLLHAPIPQESSVSPTAKISAALAAASDRRANILRAADRIDRLPHRPDVAYLTAILATQAASWGPSEKFWAERVVLRLIDLSHHLSAQETAFVLAACEQLLGQRTTSGPSLPGTGGSHGPITRRTFAVDAPPRVDFDESFGCLRDVQPPRATGTYLPRDGSDWLATLHTDRGQAFLWDTLGDLFEKVASSPPPPTPAVPLQAEIDPEPTHPLEQDRSRSPAPADPGPLALATPRPPQDATDRVSRGPSRARTAQHAHPAVVDVPGPGEMRHRRDKLQQLPTAALIHQLPRLDRFTAGLARSLLQERGYTAAEINLLQQIAAPEAATRLQAMAELQRLPARQARGHLRQLLRDTSAEVRLTALSMLATTRDPQLFELARERATTDSDARITELAHRIMRQAR